MTRRASIRQSAKIIEHDDESIAEFNYLRSDETGGRHGRRSFYVRTTPGLDDQPLYRYFNREFMDVFLTTSWSELSYGLATWDYMGIIGYANDFPGQDTTRLYRWFNGRTGRHAYTTAARPRHLRHADGWAQESQAIYVPKRSVRRQGRSAAQSNQCAIRQCKIATPLPGMEYCLEHLPRDDILMLLDATVRKVGSVRVVDLSDIQIHGPHWPIVSEWLRDKMTGIRDLHLYLDGASVSVDLVLELPECISLNLSAARLAGDLEIIGGNFSRLCLAASGVSGSLTLRHCVIREGLFADRMRVDGTIYLDELDASAGCGFFDKTRARKIHISTSKFDVLSLQECNIGARSSIAHTKIETLVCTALRVAQDLALRQCTISEYAGFRRATIDAHLGLEFNKFDGIVDLTAAQCGAAIHLAESHYAGTIIASQTSAPSLDMHGANFGGRALVTDIDVRNVLDLRESEMLEPVLITASPTHAILDDAIFHREANLQFGGTYVSVVRTRFDSVSRMGGSSRPLKLLDLTDTDVSYLELDNVDLSLCSFARALRLENLRFGGGNTFATVPRHFTGANVFRWRAKRKVVWEEILYRASINTEGWAGWRVALLSEFERAPKSDFDWARATPVPVEIAEATVQQLSAIYRDLRRSLEQSDEESESNEFYYSEMTIRRESAHGWRRVVLTLYWALGGYGVRPSRPVLAFILTSWLLATAFVRFNVLTVRGAVGADQIGYIAAFDHLFLTSTSFLGSSGTQASGFVGLALDALARLILPTLLVLAFV